MTDAYTSEMEVVADSQVIYLYCPKCPDSHHFQVLDAPVTVSDVVAGASAHAREAHGGY